MIDRSGNLFHTLCGSLLGFFSLPLTAMLIVLTAPFLGGKRAFWILAPLWARMIFRVCRAQCRLSGWEALPEEIRDRRQSVIFMANHESNLDPAVLISFLPIPAVYLAKREVKWLVPVGWAAMLAGVIFIDRRKRERAVQSIHQAADQIRAGKSVVLFPEGTRTRTGAMLPFKKGGFNLAQQANVPIIPLAAVGGFGMLPPGALWIRPGGYRLVFGSPIHPQNFASREALMAEVQARVQALKSAS